MPIDRMTPIYVAVNIVIVLKPELRRFGDTWDLGNKDPLVLLEICSLILISSWMTHFWTYEESAIGIELLLKLRDQLFPLRQARSHILATNKRRLK